MTGTYDLRLVVLSVVIAMLASFAALDLAGRVTLARRGLRTLWIAGGAFAMGLGIWSMHYIGMLAFTLPVPVRYDLRLVVLALAAAVLASAVALQVVSREAMSRARLVAGGTVMGSGIAAMHYIGMAAMRLPATMHYAPALVALSVVVAVGVSVGALALAFHLRFERGAAWPVQKLGSAVVMGAAISSMHYIGMAAARFTAGGGTVDESALEIGPLGVVAIAATTFAVLGFTIVTAMLDRQLTKNMARLQESEGARRQQQRFLRDVIDADPHLVFAKDAEGVFRLANRATAELFGTTPAGLVGTTGGTADRHPGEIADARGIDLGVITSGEPTVVPEIHVSGAGGTASEARWYQAVTVPLELGDGRQRLALTVATDITMLKVLEEQLRHAQKMEAVGRLAGGIAHDFNNLITVVSGHAELMLEDLAPDDEHRHDLEGIRGAARRAAALTQQLLAFSRRQVLQPKVIDLNVLVGGTSDMLRRLLGADVRFEFAGGQPLGAVRADPGQLEQVLMNLAVNARDAMPGGGALSIATRDVEVDDQFAQAHLGMTAGRYVLLTVSDTGEGMSAVTKLHLFEPFFTTKGPGKGTGLGLATVYGIVKQSGGYIIVDSETGTGTTFRIYLPRVDAEAADPVSVPAPAPRNGSETVLLVEDEDAVRRLTRTMLDRLGYRVFEASDGTQALALASTFDGDIDVLVTDLVMPRMGGRELAERLTAVRPRTRVLFVSGYTGDALVQLAVNDREIAFLQKPFGVADLSAKLRLLLGG